MGAVWGSPNKKDENIFGPRLGSPYYGTLTPVFLAEGFPHRHTNGSGGIQCTPQLKA